MATGKSKPKGATAYRRIINRRAMHDYHLDDKVEVGIELRGSEVKSIRASQVSLAEGFAAVDPNTMQLYLHNIDIARYSHGGLDQHEPKRTRRLLAHKRQIRDLHDKTKGKGVTLVPLSMYFVAGRVKLELAVGVGKKAYDKRQRLKEQEADRQIRRGMSRQVRR